MATVAMDISKPTPAASGDEAAAAAKGRSGGGGEGLRQYYLQHIHDLQLQIRQKTHNLNRLEAQRNDLNSRGDISSRLSPQTLESMCPSRAAFWLGESSITLMETLPLAGCESWSNARALGCSCLDNWVSTPGCSST
jgi:hypothetical protein